MLHEYPFVIAEKLLQTHVRTLSRPMNRSQTTADQSSACLRWAIRSWCPPAASALPTSNQERQERASDQACKTALACCRSLRLGLVRRQEPLAVDSWGDSAPHPRA